MAPLPLLKLAAMLLKTISKPLAAAFIVQSKYNRPLSKICILAGELYHQTHSRIQIFAAGYRVVGVKQLPEEEALKSGAAVASEGLLLVLASGIVVYEYNASSKQSALKALRAEQQELAEKQLLESRFRELREQIDELRGRLDQAERDRSAAAAERTMSAHKKSCLGCWLFPFYPSTPPTTKQSSE